ncbi:MAG: phytanoyl-CoA dioxygenase family protein [Aquabacterium sp.]
MTAALPDTATIHAFQRDGAVVLRGLLDAADLARLERGIERNLAEPGPLALVASRPDDPGRFFEDFCNWQRIPEYAATLRDTALPRVAAALMGSSRVRLYHDHLLVKEPGTRQPTPWHQDQPYYNVDGLQNVSFWIPVDPVSEAATLRFLAGSNRGPWLMPRTFLTAEARWFPEGALQELPDMDHADQRAREIGWALQPGDAVAFHMLTLHTAAGVGPGQRRRVFSARYLGDDMVHAPRRWRTSPPFEGLAQRLPAGVPMDDPLFPLVWPRPGHPPT